MNADFLKNLPLSAVLLLGGALCVVLGAAETFTIGKYSVRMLPDYNIVVIVAGAVVLLAGLLQLRHRVTNSDDSVPAKNVTIGHVDLVSEGEYPRIRISGRIEPPKSGVRVWIVREHVANSPGRFHVGAQPAVTDNRGEWQQFTNLWTGGAFRIHAVVGSKTAETLLAYYRRAFEHARAVYRQHVEQDASSFPDWPNLEELPATSISDFQQINI